MTLKFEVLSEKKQKAHFAFGLNFCKLHWKRENEKENELKQQPR